MTYVWGMWVFYFLGDCKIKALTVIATPACTQVTCLVEEGSGYRAPLQNANAETSLLCCNCFAPVIWWCLITFIFAHNRALQTPHSLADMSQLFYVKHCFVSWCKHFFYIAILSFPIFLIFKGMPESVLQRLNLHSERGGCLCTRAMLPRLSGTPRSLC